MIESGNLDRVAIFERQVETVADSGAVLKTWAPFLTLRAELRELRTDEVATGFGEGDARAVVLVVRWHPTAILTSDRVVIDGRAYDIKQIAELGRRGGWKLAAVAA